MNTTDRSALVATVTVVFSAAEDELHAAHHASPEDVAAHLFEHEEVSAVRIDAHGRPSGYRVDVPLGSHEEAAERATALAGDVAAGLEITAAVLSVGLMRDEDRVEVYRVGNRGDDLVWGERGAVAGASETPLHGNRGSVGLAEEEAT